MRPDLRSFSFTWMKGSQQEDQATNGRPTTRGAAASASTSASHPNLRSGILKSSNQPGSRNDGGGKMKGKKIDKKEFYGCNPSKLKQLKEFGSSLFGNSSKATSNNAKTEYFTIQEEPIEFTDDEMDDVDVDVDAAPQFEGFGQLADENAVPVPAAALETGQQVKEDSFDKKSLRSTTLKSGIGMKINKKVQDVKSSFGNLSQKFRRSTRRQYRMTTPLTSAESTPTRKMLGRTPTRLYSPFGFVDSPATGLRSTPIQKTPKRLQRPSTPRLPRKLTTPVHTELFKAYSPNGALQKDIQDIGMGFQELQVISQNISRRNLRY